MIMQTIKEYFKKIPKEIIYILQLFFVTRFFLTFIGMTAVYYHPTREYYSSFKFLNIWGLWDSAWYINIAKIGYSINLNYLKQANYGFFPLYPLCIKIFSFVFQNYFISALIVSNLFFILAAIFLYKLIRLDYDEETSFRAIKYLFIFPAAFLFSAALSESLFLFLIVVCFYFARNERWFLTGFFGMLVTLTKPFGFIILIPIAYEYIMMKKKEKKLTILEKIRDVCSISLIPLGLVLFATYTYFVIGDFFAYPHIKAIGIGWQDHLESPLRVVISSLASGLIGYVWGAIASILVILFLMYFYKKVRFSYFLSGLLIVIFCISYTGTLTGALRYYTAIFPIYIIFGQLSSNRKLDDFLMISLLLLQGFLMAFWTIQSGIII